MVLNGRRPKKPLTVADVSARVEIISQDKDNESAHGKEDALWQEVLRAIARGAADPAALAREALRTTRLRFSRWYA